MTHKSVLQECHLDICSFSNVFPFGFVGSILFFQMRCPPKKDTRIRCAGVLHQNPIHPFFQKGQGTGTGHPLEPQEPQHRAASSRWPCGRPQAARRLLGAGRWTPVARRMDQTGLRTRPTGLLYSELVLPPQLQNARTPATDGKQSFCCPLFRPYLFAKRGVLKRVDPRSQVKEFH